MQLATREHFGEPQNVFVRAVERGRVYHDAVGQRREPVKELVLCVRNVLPPKKDWHVRHKQRRDRRRDVLDYRARSLNRYLLAADSLRAACRDLATCRGVRVEPRLVRFALGRDKNRAARMLLDNRLKKLVGL